MSSNGHSWLSLRPSLPQRPCLILQDWRCHHLLSLSRSFRGALPCRMALGRSHRRPAIPLPFPGGLGEWQAAGCREVTCDPAGCLPRGLHQPHQSGEEEPSTKSWHWSLTAPPTSSSFSFLSCSTDLPGKARDGPRQVRWQQRRRLLGAHLGHSCIVPPYGESTMRLCRQGCGDGVAGPNPPPAVAGEWQRGHARGQRKQLHSWRGPCCLGREPAGVPILPSLQGGGGRWGDLPQPWSLHIQQTQTQATVQPCTCSMWSRVNIPVRVALWLLWPMPRTQRLGTVWWASPGVRAGGAAALGLQPGSPSRLAGVGGNAVVSPPLAVSCARPPPACVGA